MKFAVIVSKKDIAGMNIKNSLLNLFDFKEKGKFQNIAFYEIKIEDRFVLLYTLNEETVHFETAEKDIDADYFIFATRHQSKSGERTLSVHVPGNFSRAEMGGKDSEFCTAASSLMKQAFIIENELGKEIGFKITMEATHHGPLIRKPVIFIEIGSKEEEWRNKKAADVIAKTIISTIKNYEKKDYETAIAFGGLHYCSNFNKIERATDVAITHVCPKYNILYITKELISKMMNASDKKADYALIDWKGIPAEDRKRLVSLLDEMKIIWKKVR